jgi:hypothetical protein
VSDAGDTHDVGSLVEEAAKLLGTLSGWARDAAGDAGEGLSGFAAQAASSAHDLDEHLATGSAECTVCPVCRTIHAVRQLSPEVLAHLTTAMASLAQAAATMMATPDPGAASTRPDVEHIDVDAEWPED